MNGSHGTNSAYTRGCRCGDCRAAHTQAARDAKTRTDTYPNRRVYIDDVEWLMDAREHPDQIAARLGVERKSLNTALRRKGRHDLIERMARLVVT